MEQHTQEGAQKGKTEEEKKQLLELLTEQAHEQFDESELFLYFEKGDAYVMTIDQILDICGIHIAATLPIPAAIELFKKFSADETALRQNMEGMHKTGLERSRAYLANRALAQLSEG